MTFKYALTCLGVFAFGFLVDVAWTRYTQATIAKRRWAGGNWSVVIYLSGATNVMAYTSDRWLLIPAVIGAWAGSFYAISREARPAA